MRIVWIDLAKRNHEACVIVESGKAIGGTLRFANTSVGAARLLKHIAQFNPDNQPVVIDMEAMGYY